MPNHLTDISLRQAAFITGAAILIMTIAAFVAMDVTIGSLVVQNDAAATFNNIQASEMSFRTGVMSWLIILISDILAAWGLYNFLKPVSPDLSLIMAWFRLVYAAILGTALLQFGDVLLLLNGNGYLAPLAIEQRQSEVLLSINGFYQGWSIGLIIFGIHILLLGYLIIRSTYIPKFWGILLIIASFGYLITNLADVMVAGYENIKMILDWIFIIPMLSEVGLGLWLLIKGVNVTEERTKKS